MPGGRIGYGGTLERQIDSVWTAVPYAKDFKPGNPTVEKIKNNNYDNETATNDYIPGFVDYNSATFVLSSFDPANAVHAGIKDDVGDQSAEGSWRFTYSNASSSVETFTAWIEGMDGSENVEGLVEYTVTLCVTAKPVIT